MFDISGVNKRYFEVTLYETTDEGEIENSIKLEVEPPKLKVLKKITRLSKSKEENTIEELTDSIRLILNKNKARAKVPEIFIEDLDMDQMDMLMTKYFDWLNNAKNSPN
ncbi:MAG: hypothetical protein KH415_18565 [Clostridium sp.]|nr:hypothetical protein [Clostridium sp.]